MSVQRIRSATEIDAELPDSRFRRALALVDDDAWLEAAPGPEPAPEEEPGFLSSEPHSPSGGKQPPTFRTARQVVAEAPEHVRWLLTGYVALGCLHEFVGKAKAAGKTTWLLRLVAAVLGGRPFLGHTTAEGPVVFLTEQPGPSLRSALVRAGLADREDLSVLTWREGRGTPWPEIVAAAIAECERLGAVLLVVDTLPAFAGIRGDAENDAGAALEAIAPLQAAATDGLAVIVVRHERKSGGEVGDSARGSSAFTGAVDVVLRLARKPDAPRETIRVLSALSRFDETPPEVMIELTDAGYIVLGDAAAIALSEARAAVRASLDAEDELTRQELQEAAKAECDAKPTTVQAAIAELLAAGEIDRSGAGKRGQPYRYRLVRMFPPPLRVRAPEESNSGTPDLVDEAHRIFGDDLAPWDGATA